MQIIPRHAVRFRTRRQSVGWGVSVAAFASLSLLGSSAVAQAATHQASNPMGKPPITAQVMPKSRMVTTTITVPPHTPLTDVVVEPALNGPGGGLTYPPPPTQAAQLNAIERATERTLGTAFFPTSAIQKKLLSPSKVAVTVTVPAGSAPGLYEAVIGVVNPHPYPHKSGAGKSGAGNSGGTTGDHASQQSWAFLTPWQITVPGAVSTPPLKIASVVWMRATPTGPIEPAVVLTNPRHAISGRVPITVTLLEHGQIRQTHTLTFNAIQPDSTAWSRPIALSFHPSGRYTVRVTGPGLASYATTSLPPSAVASAPHASPAALRRTDPPASPHPTIPGWGYGVVGLIVGVGGTLLATRRRSAGWV